MIETSFRIAEFLKHQSAVKVVTHIDADGLSSGAIASLALDRAGIPHEIEFIKQLDEAKVSDLQEVREVIWFTDLGSAKLDSFDPTRTIITDHHIPQTRDEGSDAAITFPPPPSPVKQGQRSLFDFSPSTPSNSDTDTHAVIDPPIKKERTSDLYQPYHLNPHIFEHDGSTEISGAGLTYLVARAMDPGNVDLSAIAIVGAVGDLQDSANCRLVGLNRGILKDAVDNGVIEMDTDVRYFGRETRPIHKVLQYSSDPIVPTVSGSEGGALEFLMESGIELKDGDGFRSWIQLTREEKRTIVSGMVRLALTLGLDPADVRRMTGEVYSLPMNEIGTPLHDAKEFATMLNACGKNLNPEVGFHVLKGDREEYLQRAYTLLQGHRRNLATYIQLVEKDLGITKLDAIQYFDAGTDIPENLVGIVAGMVLNSGGSDLEKVMVGLASAENGIKISARTTRMMVNRGVDLAEALKITSKKVGGEGGGHNIAAGAFVPKDTVDEFLSLFEKCVKEQLH